ncbi:MAG: YjfB family protein [Lachnospiraceae bacterium]|nr:YjfB family protein [Lachnospiraceae bacterium]
MDVGGVLTVTLSDAKTRNDIGMAVLAKQMDTEEQAGVAMIDMMNKSFMEKSVNPKVGGNIDISI